MLAQHLASQAVWSNCYLSPVSFVPLLPSKNLVAQTVEVCYFMCAISAGREGMTVNVSRTCYAS